MFIIAPKERRGTAYFVTLAYLLMWLASSVA